MYSPAFRIRLAPTGGSLHTGLRRVLVPFLACEPIIEKNGQKVKREICFSDFTACSLLQTRFSPERLYGIMLMERAVLSFSNRIDLNGIAVRLRPLRRSAAFRRMDGQIFSAGKRVLRNALYAGRQINIT